MALVSRSISYVVAVAAASLTLAGTAEAQQPVGALGQPGVGFIMAIIVGAIAGWLAEQFTKANMGLLANIIMGIIGAVVGNLLAGLVGIHVYGILGNLVVATIGAVIVITVYRAVMGRRTTY